MSVQKPSNNQISHPLGIPFLNTTYPAPLTALILSYVSYSDPAKPDEDLGYYIPPLFMASLSEENVDCAAKVAHLNAVIALLKQPSIQASPAAQNRLLPFQLALSLHGQRVSDILQDAQIILSDDALRLFKCFLKPFHLNSEDLCSKNTCIQVSEALMRTMLGDSKVFIRAMDDNDDAILCAMGKDIDIMRIMDDDDDGREPDAIDLQRVETLSEKTTALRLFVKVFHQWYNKLCGECIDVSQLKHHHDDEVLTTLWSNIGLPLLEYEYSMDFVLDIFSNKMNCYQGDIKKWGGYSKERYGLYGEAVLQQHLVVQIINMLKSHQGIGPVEESHQAFCDFFKARFQFFIS